MEKTMLDDFIKYAKEKFDCDIQIEKSDNPDTFESVFGASFLSDDGDEDKVDGVDDMDYKETYKTISSKQMNISVM